jgi:SAM-dependent methyltransferase
MVEAALLTLFPRVIPLDFPAAVYRARRDTPKNRAVRLLASAVRANYEVVMAERLVEIPFVFRHLPRPGVSVLDFGCSDSVLAIQLASLGYDVVGVDLRPYPLTHRRFRFVHGDFLAAGFPSEMFDAVVAVSAVEHCGLGAYGDRVPREDGDRQVIEEMARVVRPGGRLLLTVPYGVGGSTSWYRVYDATTLHALLGGFTIDAVEYYEGRGRRDWHPVPAEALRGLDSAKPGYVQGVACVVAQKR